MDTHVQFAEQRQLASRHNAALLPCSAPPEILCSIFLVLRALDIQARCAEPTIDGNPPPDVLVTTWVCQSWRNTALGYPQLWTTLFEWYSRELWEWMLSHSGACPLTFYGNSLDSHVQDQNWRHTTTLYTVLQEIGRMREVHLNLFNGQEQVEREVMRIFRNHSPLPLLKVLALEDVYYVNWSVVSMPHLRCLRTVDRNFGLRDTMFPTAPNLTALEMDCESYNDIRPALRFVGANFGCLSTLTLRLDASGSLPESSPIPFPALKLLRLVGGLPSVGYSASCFQISVACHLYVQIECPGTMSVPIDDDEFEPLEHLIHNRTDGQFTKPPFGFLEFEDGNIHVLLDMAPPSLDYLWQWSTDTEVCMKDFSLTPDLSAPLMFDFLDVEWYPTWLHYYYKLVAPGSLQNVILQCYNTSSSYIEQSLDGVAFWPEFFQRMERVETLRVNHDCEGLPILDILAGGTLLPKLRHFTLDDVALAEDGSMEMLAARISDYEALRSPPLELFSILAPYGDDESEEQLKTMIDGLQRPNIMYGQVSEV